MNRTSIKRKISKIHTIMMKNNRRYVRDSSEQRKEKQNNLNLLVDFKNFKLDCVIFTVKE